MEGDALSSPLRYGGHGGPPSNSRPPKEIYLTE